MSEGFKLYRYVTALAGFLLMAVPASATSHTQGNLADILSQTFLPAGTQIIGPQGVIYGVLLPFIIVFTIIYVGMRRMNLLGKRETQVLALAISLFLIPSGGYRVISQFLLTLFGLGAAGFGVPGISGGLPQISLFQGLNPLQQCTAMSAIVGALAAFFLNMGPTPSNNDDNGEGEDNGGSRISGVLGKGGIQLTEIFIIIALMVATWLTTCGFAPLLTAVGWFLVFIVGMRLITAYYKVGGGGIPALLSLVGLLVIAMLIRSQSMFPQELRTIGDWILGGVIGIVVLIAVVVVILAYIAWVWAD